ncbi:MAG: flavodoxin family protein, partial [Thermodesulfobacteriota bacterium]
MKVIGFNGSPNKKGNTACSLNIIFEELENAGIETEMIQVGKKKIQGCTACHDCVKKQNEACSLDGDPVNEWIQKIKAADGIL